MANTYLPPTIVIPGSLIISAISQTSPMIVTVIDSDKNSYMVGQLVHLTVPDGYGMFQANQRTGKILAIDGVDFTLDIDASGFDPFVVPADGSGIKKPASLAPAGSRGLEFSNETRLEPFQSLNNRGN